MDDPRRWLTADETAVLLRLHVMTVYGLCLRGILPALKLGKEWWVSARRLAEQAEHFEAYAPIIQQPTDQAAEKAAARVLNEVTGAFARERTRRQFLRAIS